MRQQQQTLKSELADQQEENKIDNQGGVFTHKEDQLKSVQATSNKIEDKQVKLADELKIQSDKINKNSKKFKEKINANLYQFLEKNQTANNLNQHQTRTNQNNKKVDSLETDQSLLDQDQSANQDDQNPTQSLRIPQVNQQQQANPFNQLSQPIYQNNLTPFEKQTMATFKLMQNQLNSQSVQMNAQAVQMNAQTEHMNAQTDALRHLLNQQTDSKQDFQRIEDSIKELTGFVRKLVPKELLQEESKEKQTLSDINVYDKSEKNKITGFIDQNLSNIQKQSDNLSNGNELQQTHESKLKYFYN